MLQIIITVGLGVCVGIIAYTLPQVIKGVKFPVKRGRGTVTSLQRLHIAWKVMRAKRFFIVAGDLTAAQIDPEFIEFVHGEVEKAFGEIVKEFPNELKLKPRDKPTTKREPVKKWELEIIEKPSKKGGE